MVAVSLCSEPYIYCITVNFSSQGTLGGPDIVQRAVFGLAVVVRGDYNPSPPCPACAWGSWKLPEIASPQTSWTSRWPRWSVGPGGYTESYTLGRKQPRRRLNPRLSVKRAIVLKVCSQGAGTQKNNFCPIKTLNVCKQPWSRSVNKQTNRETWSYYKCYDRHILKWIEMKESPRSETVESSRIFLPAIHFPSLILPRVPSVACSSVASSLAPLLTSLLTCFLP